VKQSTSPKHSRKRSAQPDATASASAR
jgi:hypothetical protein